MVSLMGLDIGTTGCKASLFNEEGALLSAAYMEYPTEQPGGGTYELDPERVWEAVRQVISEALLKVPGAEIRALSLSSLGEAVVPVDSDGRALGRAILYMDQRGIEQAAILERKVGKNRTMEITGVPLHPMFSLPKVMWIKQHQPEIYSKVWKFMPFGDYIAFLLTGRCATDYTMASRTMGLNVSAKQWDTVMFDAAGIEIGKFPELVQSGTPLGCIRQEIAEALGINADALVVAGGHDQACAALGAGILSTNQAVDGIGTVECITPAYSSPVLGSKMLEGRYNCAPHIIEGLYLTYAFNFTGGSLIRWYRDNFGHAAETEARARGVSEYDYLNSTAAVEPTDLLVVPHFAGSGTPYMNPDAKGTLYGLTLGTNAAQIYRALLEGVTYEMRYNLDCLKEAGIEVQALRAVGGGAKSDLWLQIKADIMNVPIERLSVSEAGTMGNIILAGTASGVYRSYEEAVRVLVKPVDIFEPEQPNQSRYEERYERYKRLSKAVADL
ncbi:FGGY-family carbohydrate kinase [Paenibacillus sp. HB172176]|uniref:FGGY-family carbohydrate kinase n=1 Tax=Paenibacillus sp. HB172176 TaxID=2493690 RepID=UPI001438A078|nr:FGGY-family carbohydrate kinase [Paenibacillus sp. HB172176]